MNWRQSRNQREQLQRLEKFLLGDKRLAIANDVKT
jgi:hypothetical protein